MNLVNKRICVTGSGGFLGSFVVDALRARGCTDLILPRKREYDLRDAKDIERLL